MVSHDDIRPIALCLPDAAEPKKFFTTPHHDGEPIVLVRLDQVNEKEAARLIVESGRQRATKTAVAAWDAAH